MSLDYGTLKEMVKMTYEFNSSMGQPVDTGYSMPNDLSLLRLKLIEEETKEFINAILHETDANRLKEGCDLLYVLAGTVATVGMEACNNIPVNFKTAKIPSTPIEDLSPYCKLIETANNLAAQVVKCHPDKSTRKWYVEIHIPYCMSLIFDLLTNYFFYGDTGLTLTAFKTVHDSNMSKLDDDGKPIRREDGKILKGPNYYPPDMTPFTILRKNGGERR